MVESVRVMDNSQAARSECAEVTVSTLSKAIVAALEDESVAGVQRFPEMEELETRID
ncbi:unnamed protein product [Effrenium voratum]|uniref:Uncharacterized protein n=1 Tax=Effrenium voratum TaxID=2562239 RepID=A0AA36HTC9_9DINO|nr:unnamed protein product [Effrenium voratum]CAJ1430774.1 unnamed protein product [Effrenium voratum]